MKHFTDLKFNKQELEKKLLSFPTDQQQRIQQALTLAEKHHAGQVRNAEKPKNTPYIIHPIGCALWLIEQKITDIDIIIATILHDTLEDTQLSPDTIKSQFGKRILELVKSVTRERSTDETEEQKRVNKIEHFKKLTDEPAATKLIKAADFLDNMRSWPFVPINASMAYKIPRWIKEAEQYYIPIANAVAPQAVPEMEEIVTKVKEKFS